MPRREPLIHELIAKHGGKPEPILKWKATCHQYVSTKAAVLPDGAIHTHDGFNEIIVEPPPDPIGNMEARLLYHSTCLLRIDLDLRAMELAKEGRGEARWSEERYGPLPGTPRNRFAIDYPKAIAILNKYRSEHARQVGDLKAGIWLVKDRASAARARELRGELST